MVCMQPSFTQSNAQSWARSPFLCCRSPVVESSREFALPAQELQRLLKHVLASLLGKRVVVDRGAPDVVEVGVTSGGREGSEQKRQPPQDHKALQQQDSQKAARRWR